MQSHHQSFIMNKPRQIKAMHQQRGVVLFLALIALVVMSLAAVALIRSVDTNTIIAGNLASKQSATTSADSGMETAIFWIAANPTILDVDKVTQGYYATQEKDPIKFSWNAADSVVAEGPSITAGTDLGGNTIRYVVQRMCRAPGPPTADNCLFGAPVAGTSSQAVRPAPLAGAPTVAGQSPVYRITARVTSAKNTISYIQAFVY